MYICYDKLWKLLLERNIRKTEMSEVAGLNSRTLAKLSKNETVTTDTIARICKALHCDVSDIMEYRDAEKAATLYEAFQNSAKVLARTPTCVSYALLFRGKKYLIHQSVTKANKDSTIRCKENGTVVWEQTYRFDGTSAPTKTEEVLLRPSYRSDCTTLVLIQGKPSKITGLNEGIFLSPDYKGEKRGVCVLSTAAFKLYGG